MDPRVLVQAFGKTGMPRKVIFSCADIAFKNVSLYSCVCSSAFLRQMQNLNFYTELNETLIKYITAFNPAAPGRFLPLYSAPALPRSRSAG